MHLTQCHRSVKSRLVVGDDERFKRGVPFGPSALAAQPFTQLVISCASSAFAGRTSFDQFCSDVFVEHDEIF